jgi:hypothetical protein
MNYLKYRKHPRVYTKKNHTCDEKVLSLTAAAAVGILAFTFAKGFFWGYMLKKRLS